MVWFKGHPGLVGIVNAVVASPSAPPEAPDEPYQHNPLPYVPPPVKPPRKNKTLRGLLYAGIGITALGLAAAAAVFGSRAVTQQPQPAPTATVVAVATTTPMPTSTPEIDFSYYEPREWPTPTPAAIPTPTVPAYVPPTWTPSIYTPFTPEPEESTPTPTPEQTQIPTPKPTPTVTPIPTPSLEEIIKEAKAVIEKYRNDYTTIITDYATIKPIVDAVIGQTGLKYDNITVTILPREEFNKRYCGLSVMKNYLNCVEDLNKSDISLAYAKWGGETADVFVRENRFYQANAATLREVLLAIALTNYNSNSTMAAEIAGNLGSVFTNATLAEKLGYDPHYNIADTPENRRSLNGVGGSPRYDNPNWRNDSNFWKWAAWAILEDKGFLNRNKPEQRVTKEQAWQAYNFFINLEDPDKYVEDIIAKRDPPKDAEWVRQVMMFRLNQNQPPSESDTVKMNEYLFYLP